MNPIETLHAFVRVAELHSFTQAAEQLGCPKASVSLAIQQLEAQVGARLLLRTTRRVQLTPDGALFYERSKDVLADLDELQGLFRQQPEQLSGRLRVDMPVSTARNLVLPRLPEFMRQHPLLKLELSCTDRRVDLVREGFDCVLRVGRLEESGLVARPLGQLAQVNCASPAYLQAQGHPQTLADLAGHQLVHYQSPLGARGGGWEWCDERGQCHTLPMQGALSVNSTEAYQAACLAGLGLIQAPLAGLRPWMDSGQLVEVLPRYRAPPLPVSLLYPHRRQLARRVQVFMDWLAGVLIPYVDGPSDSARSASQSSNSMVP
jgi:DNA-binding transcriptional LysR family regulator